MDRTADSRFESETKQRCHARYDLISVIKHSGGADRVKFDRFLVPVITVSRSRSDLTLAEARNAICDARQTTTTRLSLLKLTAQHVTPQSRCEPCYLVLY